jgi:carbamoyl-phosphate synthase large subunit
VSRPYNILVTGVGAIIGYGIIGSIRKSGLDCRVIGTDIYEENYGRHICDDFVKVPLTSSEDYLDILSDIVARHDIDLVIPGIEQDAQFLNSMRHSLDFKVVLNNEELIQLSSDKWAMYCHLKDAAFGNLIPTTLGRDTDELAETVGFPFIIKPRASYAAKGFHIIRDENDLNRVRPIINRDTLFQPLIGSADDEYSVSAFGDGEGGIVDSLLIRRHLSAAGASEKAFIVRDDKSIMSAVLWLVNHFKAEGPTNFQFRKQGEKAFLLEINPRVSSACSIRTAFGYNEPRLSIEHYLKGRSYTIEPKRDGKAIRYIADRVIFE